MPRLKPQEKTKKRISVFLSEKDCEAIEKLCGNEKGPGYSEFCRDAVKERIWRIQKDEKDKLEV